jgi:hypothetical protein
MVEYAAVGNALERADRGKKKFVRNARGGVFIYLREDCSRDSSLKVNSVLAVVWMKVIKSEGAVLVKSVQPIENIYYTVNKWMSRKGVIKVSANGRDQSC